MVIVSLGYSPKLATNSDNNCESGVWYCNVITISIAVMLLGFMMIYLMILYQHSNAVGWIAVIGASITFGATGVPMKMKDILKKEIDPLQLSIFTSIGIFTVNLPLMIYLGINQTFQFQPLAIIGSIEVFFIGLFAFHAVKSLGYSKSIAIWCGKELTCILV